MSLQYIEYFQTRESQKNRTGNADTIGDLVFHPLGNEQGVYYFYSLNTGRTIIHNCCAPLPIPDDVIGRVHALYQNYPK